MNYKGSIKWRERGYISSPALCVLVVIPSTAFCKHLKRLRLLELELRWEELSWLFWFLPYIVKVKRTWIVKKYTVGTIAQLSKREKETTNCRHISISSNARSAGGGRFLSDFVIKLISWLRPFMSAFQLKANVCEHVQRQRNRLNVEQSTSP